VTSEQLCALISYDDAPEGVCWFLTVWANRADGDFGGPDPDPVTYPPTPVTVVAERRRRENESKREDWTALYSTVQYTSEQFSTVQN
jgi:hypothetical protein